MEKFDAFEDPSGKVVAGETGGPKKRNAGQIKELEQEMKLLHWHKLANEGALKAALIRTKKLKAASNSSNGTDWFEFWVKMLINILPTLCIKHKVI